MKIATLASGAPADGAPASRAVRRCARQAEQGRRPGASKVKDLKISDADERKIGEQRQPAGARTSSASFRTRR